ncbi:MAG: GNAT family N-acetyltransferase [Dysgonamonadaceae bacterium]|jgi:GNAT superfamily N-acetyltransferase|nr:GNAT family N-acetyltransferase [Dysgonamonadaceae bacterium]
MPPVRNTIIKVCNYADARQREALATLIDAYIRDDMGGGTPLSPTGKMHLIDGLSNHPSAIVLLAQTGGLYTGLLVAFENFSTFTARPMINIHDIIVLPEYRGKGIGRRLMEVVIRIAEEKKCSRLTLEVRKDNLPAQHLYQTLGFDEAEPGMFYWRKTI